MKRILFSFIIFTLCLSNLWSKDPFEVTLGTDVSAHKPFDFSADYIRYSRHNNSVEAKGNVVISQENTVVTANSATVLPNDKYIYVKGDVRIENLETKETVNADEIYILGSFEQIMAKYVTTVLKNDMVIGAEETFQDNNMLNIKKGKITTCPIYNLSSPIWDISSSNISINKDDGSVNMKNALIRIKGVPVMWTPYAFVSTETERKAGFLVPGFTMFDNLWGFGMTNTFFVPIGDHNNISLVNEVSTKLKPRTALEYEGYFGKTSANFKAGIQDIELYSDDPITYFVGYIDSDLGKYFRSHGQIEYSSQDRYFKQYDIIALDNDKKFYENNIDIEGIFAHGYVNAKYAQFTRIYHPTDTTRAEKVTTQLPTISGNYYYNNKYIGLTEFSANSIGIDNIDYKNTYRTMGTISAKQSYATKIGNYEFEESVSSAYYTGEESGIDNAGDKLEDSYVSGITFAKWELPIHASFGSTYGNIVPTIAINKIYDFKSKTTNVGIDSYNHEYEVSIINAFNKNMLVNNDYYIPAAYTSYGLSWYFTNASGSLDTYGHIVQMKFLDSTYKNNDYLEAIESNYLVYFDIRPYKYIKLYADANINDENFRIAESSFGFTVGTASVGTTLSGHYYNDDNSEINQYKYSNSIDLSIFAVLYKNFSTRLTIETESNNNKFIIDESSIYLGWKNHCSSFEIIASTEYINGFDIKSNYSITFRVVLKDFFILDSIS